MWVKSCYRTARLCGHLFVTKSERASARMQMRNMGVPVYELTNTGARERACFLRVSHWKSLAMWFSHVVSKITLPGIPLANRHNTLWWVCKKRKYNNTTKTTSTDYLCFTSLANTLTHKLIIRVATSIRPLCRLSQCGCMCMVLVNSQTSRGLL